ncbi:hypothetical protein VULLAG_LOCUS3365 [Vulpes lagopus]
MTQNGGDAVETSWVPPTKVLTYARDSNIGHFQGGRGRRPGGSEDVQPSAWSHSPSFSRHSLLRHPASSPWNSCSHLAPVAPHPSCTLRPWSRVSLTR